MLLSRICVCMLSIALLACAARYGWDDGTVEESFPMEASMDENWWVNSGAYFTKYEGVGSTVLGELPEDNRWRLLYARNNPRDTDDGYHPQNIFRLVTRTKWLNVEQRMYFNIDKINMSESENRNASNGVLFFGRYIDGNNLYYAGLRVDGHAVIKKKSGGTYHTLAYVPVYEGVYDNQNSPNLLPEKKWIGMRARFENHKGAVRILLYIDRESTKLSEKNREKKREKEWELVALAVDDGTLGGPPIFEQGFGGIRTDFMDVKFRAYRAQKIRD